MDLVHDMNLCIVPCGLVYTWLASLEFSAMGLMDLSIAN